MKLLSSKKKDKFSKITVYEKKKIFENKPVLQVIYKRWYERIKSNLLPEGKTLEIGSGFGDFKKSLTSCITSDIVFCEWVDIVLDAHCLPFKNGSISNIICIDALHHFNGFDNFFKEARRVLIEKGRIIFVDMYTSFISYPILKLLHFEDIHSTTIATELFFSQKKPSKSILKDFRILKKEKHDFLVYPLSGGFNYFSLVFKRRCDLLFKVEKSLGFLNHIGAFKTTVVLEKK